MDFLAEHHQTVTVAHTINNAMVLIPSSNRLSAYFGHKVFGIPEVGIFVPSGKEWCSSVSSQQQSRHSEIVTSFNPDWNIFEDAYGFDQLKGCKNVTQHYNTICFEVDNTCTREDRDFGFYINNEQQKDDEYAVMYIYSHQERKNGV